MKTLDVLLLGAGNRGARYVTLMAEQPERYRVVGVADPDPVRREYISKMHQIPAEKQFSAWEEALAQPKMADLAIVATQDTMHVAPALAAIEKGYHLLLEKPIAPTPEECAQVALAAKEKGVKVLVCHVLRYAPFYKKIKEILLEGTIGKVMSVMHVEGVGNIHQSHSYVRGNWHNSKESSPMILAKSCHDTDIIQWLVGTPCRKVQSFGDLTWFRKENAPEGAPVRCADGGCPIENECPYNCKTVYLKGKKHWRNIAARGYCKDVEATDEEVLESLKHTNYGLCVYQAKNDVVDHQVVNMEFEGGATASFTMNAFNKGGRYIRIFGTEGELYAAASDTEITVYTFRDGETRKIPVMKTVESISGGHGGGDSGLIQDLAPYMADCYEGFSASDINVAVENHLIAFAAEESRLNDTVLDMKEYAKRFRL